MLLGESRIITALQKAAKASPGDETLFAAQRGGYITLRFAGGRVHQNFHEEDVTVWVKVSRDGRAGVATTCSLKHESLLRAVESALTIARVSPKLDGGSKSPVSFSTSPPKAFTPKLITYFPATPHLPLADILQLLRGLWTNSSAQGMELAGSFVRGEEELAVVGSRGLVQYQPFTVTGVRLVATAGKGSGFGNQVCRDISQLDLEAVARRAWSFCRMNKNPKTIPMGRYDVLLEPEAVAELLEWLTYIGFGAKQVIERTSFMAGRVGEQIMSRQISISDDGANPAGLAAPFDYVGIPKQRIPLIEGGIASGVVYDSHYATIHHRASTGHAGPYDQFEGPLATHLFCAPGETPYSELLKRMGRGLWISRFHYVNGLLKPQEALMTGLTRDGTFLIRNGKVSAAVKNLRFTESILRAFSKILAVSQETRLVADPGQGFSSTVTPALLIKDFTFTGQTQ